MFITSCYIVDRDIITEINLIINLKMKNNKENKVQYKYIDYTK